MMCLKYLLAKHSLGYKLMSLVTKELILIDFKSSFCNLKRLSPHLINVLLQTFLPKQNICVLIRVRKNQIFKLKEMH